MEATRRVRAIFAERDVRMLLGAQFLAQAADGFTQAAFANVLILEPRGGDTAGRILGLFALTLLPYSILAPFLGVLVDRWKRRGVLVWTNIARVVLLATLPLWAVEGNENALYGAALVVLGFGRLFLTTKGAVLPFVLHEHHLLRGNAVSGGGGMIAALLGGVAGVAFASAAGIGRASLAAALLYAGAAWLASRLSAPMAHPREHLERLGAALARVAREMVQGVSAIWTRPRARLPMMGIFVVRTAGMLTAIAAIFVIKDTYPGEVDELGRVSSSALALGTAGVGAFCGAVAAPALNRRLDEARLVLLGFAISGLGIVALGGIANLPSVVALTFIGGFGTFTAKVAVDALVQAALPDDYRGRAFALYDLIYNLASVTAALVMFLAESGSQRVLLVGSGLVCLLLAAALGLAMKRAGILAAASAPSE